MTPGLDLIGWFSLFSFDTPYPLQFIISIPTIQQSGVGQLLACSSIIRAAISSKETAGITQSVYIQTGYDLDGSGSIPGRGKVFLFSTAFRPALGPTNPPIPRIPAAISPGVKRPGMKLTTHLHLVPRSRMVDLYLHSP
jgi:hypothetical protein